jgi:hypothetical protein
MVAQECRCFSSSLFELSTSGVVKKQLTSLTPQGQCYRMNCYRRDYLQVAFVDPFLRKLVWYSCREKGKIYIPRCVACRCER